MRRRDSHADSYTMIHAELHPPAGPADEPVPRRGAREEGRLPSPPPPDSPCDDKPSPSASGGGIGNSSVTAAVLLSCCRCWRGCRRRRCSRRQHAAAGRDDQAAAQDQRAPSGPDSDCLSFTGSGTHPHSTRAAVAASRTLRWQPSEERDPADHRAQPAEGKYEEPGFSDAVPTRLTKCGGLHSNWYWKPCS